METFWQDLRCGVRMLRKNPGFTAVAVTTLALAIGANTVIFSALNVLLFRSLPYEDPSQLVWIFASNLQLGYPRLPPNWANEMFSELLERSQSFAQSAKIKTKDFILQGANGAEQIRGMRVSANLFELLGVQPIFGRSFRHEENEWGRHRVVVLSYEFWQRHFGGDPLILGRYIDLIDAEFSDRTGAPHDSLSIQRYTIIGILPPLWQFPIGAGDFRTGDLNFPKAAQIWQPESLTMEEKQARAVLDLLIVRLKPTVTLKQADLESQNLFQRIQQEMRGQNPSELPGYGVELLPLKDQVAGTTRQALGLLLTATGFVLLIAIVNVANLLLARASARRGEFAIRATLGASRVRVMRQLLTESAVLAFLGGVLGLLLAFWGIPVLIAISPAQLPRAEEISLDGRVLGFTAGICLLTALCFGLAPGWHASKAEMNKALKEAGRASSEGHYRSRLGGCLVVAEVTLSLLLLICAGLLIHSFIRLRQVDPGYQTEHLLVLKLSFLHPKYALNVEGTFAEQLSIKHVHNPQGLFVQQLLKRLEALPGVRSAAATSWVPVEGGPDRFEAAFQIEGRPAAAPGEIDNLTVARMSFVTEDYFQTMGIPFLKGRDFTSPDLNPSAPAVRIVSEGFGRKYFPQEDPIGKRIRFSKGWGEVVGVVKDTLESELNAPAEPHLYHAAVAGQRGVSIVVRASGAIQNLATTMRNEVLALDKDQPLPSVTSMKQILSDSLASRRFQMLLLNFFAGVALLLAAMGIYGVMAYSVTQRTHEIGVRMALGAQRKDVLWLVIGKGLRLVFAGLGLGLAAALASTHILTSWLYGISATDPATFVGILLLLTAVALLACYFPARRATKVDPIVALRYE